MNNINLTREEFDKLVKSSDLEQYTQKEFNQFIADNEEILTKGNGTEELDDLEKSEYETLTEEIRSFAPVEVYETAPESSNRIMKSIMFVRQKQVEWSEEDVIIKSEDGSEKIEKAQSGVYTDTALNRKLGRVGMKYGESQEDREDKE